MGSEPRSVEVSSFGGAKSNRLEKLALQIRLKMTDIEWTMFKDEKTDIGRLKLLQGNQDIESSVFRLLQLYPTNKNKSVALGLKEDGNVAFGKEDYHKAFRLYSQALVWMPHDDTKDASVLYANRSAALFHLNEMKLTLQDAELAFSLHYPPPLHHKLYERIAKSWKNLGENNKGHKWIKKAMNALENSDLNDMKLKHLKDSYEEFAIGCKNVSRNSEYSTDIVGQTPIETSKRTDELPKVTGGRGKYLKNASKRLSLQYEEKQGRFVVANGKFIPGDVILVEKPFVSALLPEHYHRQCFQCFVGLTALIPCQNCIYASFCSKKCRDEAWDKHHQYECKILGLLKYAGISPTCYMALRMLTQSNTKEVSGWYGLALATEEDPNRLRSTQKETNVTVKSLKITKNRRRNQNNNDKLNPQNPTSRTLKNSEVYKTDHEAILHLCTHPALRRPEDYFIQVTGALYLLEVLKTTSYFSNSESVEGFQDIKSWELRYAVIILRCLQSLPYNAHAFDWEPSDTGLGSEPRAEYACGLFPTLSLFNHSCYPSVVRYLVKDTVVVRAIRNISPGEQVTENYGPHFMTSPKENRQAYLSKNYCFQCNCLPCEESWPGLETLSKELVLSYRCEYCSAFVFKSNSALLSECPNCFKPLNILESLEATMEKHEEAEALFNKGNVEKGLEVLLENISMLDTYLISPVNDLHVYQEHARVFFRSFGNKLSQLPFWDPLDILSKEHENL